MLFFFKWRSRGAYEIIHTFFPFRFGIARSGGGQMNIWPRVISRGFNDDAEAKYYDPRPKQIRWTTKKKKCMVNISGLVYTFFFCLPPLCLSDSERTRLTALCHVNRRAMCNRTTTTMSTIKYISHSDIFILICGSLGSQYSSLFALNQSQFILDCIMDLA